jgi:hypothetical protein
MDRMEPFNSPNQETNGDNMDDETRDDIMAPLGRRVPWINADAVMGALPLVSPFYTPDDHMNTRTQRPDRYANYAAERQEAERFETNGDNSMDNDPETRVKRLEDTVAGIAAARDEDVEIMAGLAKRVAWIDANVIMAMGGLALVSYACSRMGRKLDKLLATK